LEKRAELVLPGSEVGGEKGGRGGSGERNDTNNICTYEYMNKGKKATSSDHTHEVGK
jgi:hypothetical protein